MQSYNVQSPTYSHNKLNMVLNSHDITHVMKNTIKYV